MARIREISVLSVLFVALGVAAASADPIVVTRDGRLGQVLVIVSAPNGEGGVQQDRSEANDAIGVGAEVSGGDGHAAGTATVIGSLADPMHFSGEGSASAIASRGDAVSQALAQSFFRFDFNVLEPVSYAFDALVTVNGDPAFRWTGGIFDDSGAATFVDDLFESDRVLRAGTLTPGSYTFRIVAVTLALPKPQQPVVNTVGGYTFALDFAEAGAQTPEPASLVLLLTGAVALRRRLTA
jgi:hypothetical protein